MTKLKTEKTQAEKAMASLRNELRSVLTEAASVSSELADLMTEAANGLHDEQTGSERTTLHQLFTGMAGSAGRLQVKLQSAAAILSGDQFARLDEQLDRTQAAHEAAHTTGD